MVGIISGVCSSLYAANVNEKQSKKYDFSTYIPVQNKNNEYDFSKSEMSKNETLPIYPEIENSKRPSIQYDYTTKRYNLVSNNLPTLENKVENIGAPPVWNRT